ncbi:hypothetical protein [uncultured Parasutterella sp.]|mgnify:FL=1|uniref:hypothetical protein n=1 Tax=uncultured Parasutterella sp. TaxID=1263098 RepID=UPI0025B69FEA|nr:hypothetical protein [uncultured Parasutterella sp.]
MDSSLIGVIIGGSLSIIGLIIQKHYDAKNLEKNRHEEKKLRQFELKRKAYENFLMTFSQYRDSLILDFSPVVSATCLLTLYGNATIREKAARCCLLLMDWRTQIFKNNFNDPNKVGQFLNDPTTSAPKEVVILLDELHGAIIRDVQAYFDES